VAIGGDKGRLEVTLGFNYTQQNRMPFAENLNNAYTSFFEQPKSICKKGAQSVAHKIAIQSISNIRQYNNCAVVQLQRYFISLAFFLIGI